MLTIVIPSYNHSRYIKNCLEAAIECDNSRIIVIDDGSTDETVRVVEAFIDEHNQFDITLISKPNAGLISSLNMGLAATTTEYFYIVASDDIPDASGIIKCIKHLEANKEVKFCIGGADAFYDEEPNLFFKVYGSSQDRFLRLPPHKRFKQALFNYPVPLLLQSTVFRTSVLKELGGWNTELMLDDYPMFVKLLVAYPDYGLGFAYLPEISVVKYRQHQTNSFRNIPRQYGMVSEAVQFFASGFLGDLATAKALAYYSLVAIRSQNTEALSKIVNESSYKICFFSLFYFVEIPLARIVNYFKHAISRNKAI